MHKDFEPTAPAADEIVFDDFLKVDVRLGTIVKTEAFPEARKPAYKVWVDFGPVVGVRKASAQITHHYDLEGLIGRRVMGVVNFPPRQVGPVRSEVLILGFADENGHIVLAGVGDESVPNGARMA